MCKCYVKIGTSESTGRKYYALVVEYNGGANCKFFFSKMVDFLSILNLSPQEFYALEDGEYEIK